jgi:DNA-binding MarR family transcriptional regulator
MILEKEIRQTTFKDEFQKAMLNILYTGGWINSITNKFLKNYNLTPQQFNILRILRGQYPQPVSIQILMERMLDKMSNASRLVEKLRVKELIERKECSKDRRKVDVMITNKGLGLLAQIDENINAMDDKFKNISAKEAKELNKILDNFRGQ